MKKLGVSLIILVITIVVVIILAATVIISLTQGGVLDNAKKAKFMSDFRSVEEGVNVYVLSNLNASTDMNNLALPVERDKLTLEEKDEIAINVPTLKYKIEELNSGDTIYNRDLFWIKESDLSVTLSDSKKDKGYIIDAKTMQIYDYIGDEFDNKRWHTLDSGVTASQVTRDPATEELMNGWIRLTLYYPANSTERKWRLGTEGELRVDPMLMWQEYSGPITIPLDRTKDIWIKYKINQKDVTIPPAGTLLVDIIPDKIGTEKVSKVNVKIDYDTEAEVKEYRIGNSGWMTYNGEFIVTENCIIEARAKKTEKIYNEEGTLLLTRDIAGSDMIYIGNIGNLEKDLPAPHITRLSSQTPLEKARVRIDYPNSAYEKIYILNSGEEIKYTSEFPVTEWGTEILAYYYDIDGKKSKVMTITIDEIPTPEEPLKVLEAPIISRLNSQNSDEKARVSVQYPQEADKKIYTVNYGIEQIYTSELGIKEWGTTITAYYYDINGNKSKVSRIYIGMTPTAPEIEEERIPKITPPPIILREAARDQNEKASVNITYPDHASRKVYKINSGIEQVYTDKLSIKIWGTNVIAYYYDEYGNMSEMVSITINDLGGGDLPEDPEPYEPLPEYEPEKPLPPTTIDTDLDLPAPTLIRLSAQMSDEKARVQVTYPSQAVRKVYTVNSGAEIEYTSDIKIYGWDTTITAYYYDKNGKKSRIEKIYIFKDPTPPKEPEIFIPKSVVKEPTISIVPSTGIVNEVNVSVNPPVASDEIYIKVGEYSEYIKYIAPIKVKENCEVYAYYTNLDGQKSLTARAKITNIKIGTKPYLNITAEPYPWPGSKGAKEVSITFNYSDANKVEYSEDGVVYKTYISAFKVTENKRVYARAINSYGVTETYIDITNIGGGETEVPQPILKLGVNISADPDPMVTTTKVAKVKIIIEYDQRATEKLYSIGKMGDVKSYTGPFEVTSNCTIYAYAKGENSYGETNKTIDNVLDGISEPIIATDPLQSTSAKKVKVNIQYDKYATIKRYSINGGILQDYTQSFEVTENSIIYAYNENAAGQKAGTYFNIRNIIPDPPVLLLDKGNYYLLKLNYPEGSNDRQYKWKENGEWKQYKEAGILLIKPQYKDLVIKGGTIIKIEDENGKTIDFNGDYYMLDVSIRELFENVFMRWDRSVPKAPQITLNTIEPVKQVTATILYELGLLKKQYRVLKPGEELGEWQNYTGPITIDRNNSIIYARGMDDAEVWSQEAVYKVTNIDEIAPEINVTADLTTAQQIVNLSVKATDDIGISKVKWASGTQGESYFVNGGTEIPNNSNIEINQNGYYTIYAEDNVGNTQVYTLNVTNIDLTPPNILISVTPDSSLSTNVNVNIDYNDATVKQYKIGVNNNTWSTYSSSVAISSYTVLSNNWKNADGTVTIFAKGKDIAGNEVIVQKKITSLDLDMPSTPVINTQSGYPIISVYGIRFDSGTTIDYANRSDIDNYYSTDNGVTWQLYQGEFNVASGTVMAKSVKKVSGLQVTTSKTIVTPSDALQSQAYDNNVSTAIIGSATQYMLVDSTMIGQKILVNCSLDSYNFGNAGVYSATARITYLDINSQQISYVNISNGSSTLTIPANTKWIKYNGYATYYGGYNINPRLYEIQTTNEPTFTANSVYMLLTYNETDAIKDPYQSVSIIYYPTSVQKLYRIGTTGNWLNYQDQPIKVMQGETLYAKGIDQYGIETRIVSSYTCNITDALTKEAYDKNSSTNIGTTYINQVITKLMDVDPSMEGKQAILSCNASTSGGRNSSVMVTFLNSSNQEISSVYKASSFNGSITIPTNTRKIRFTITASYYTYAEVSYPLHAYLYDIYPSNW